MIVDYCNVILEVVKIGDVISITNPNLKINCEYNTISNKIKGKTGKGTNITKDLISELVKDFTDLKLKQMQVLSDYSKNIISYNHDKYIYIPEIKELNLNKTNLQIIENKIVDIVTNKSLKCIKSLSGFKVYSAAHIDNIKSRLIVLDLGYNTVHEVIEDLGYTNEKLYDWLQYLLDGGSIELAKKHNANCIKNYKNNKKSN